MDINVIWVLVLAICTPIAGVVGFAVQLKRLKKLELDKTKLKLEITSLEKKLLEAENQVIKPTNEEVIQYSKKTHEIEKPIILSRRVRRDPFLEELVSSQEGVRWSNFLILILFSFLSVYLVYDIYRFYNWLITLF